MPSPEAPVRIGLFVPCFVDRLAPDAAWAAWRVLRHFGAEVVVASPAPACCGQPLATMGAPQSACELPGAYARAHAGCDVVVSLSASCAAFVRGHHAHIAREVDRLAVQKAPPTQTFCAVLWHTLGLRRLDGRFPHRVGLHPGCHGLRELGLGPSSEAPRTHRGPPAPAEALLETLDGLTWATPARPDECCGFGGVFSTREPAVSQRMGRDRLSAYASAEVLTSTDPSCLLHLQTLQNTPLPRILSLPELIAEALGLPSGPPP